MVVGVADVLVVVTIVGVLAVAGLVVLRQRAHDGVATEIATWASGLGVDRVAWPADLREAVPALLAAGVVPVLVDDDVPAQQLAIARTEVVVTRPGARAPVPVVATHRAGDLTAHRVDVDEAASVPLEVGETVSEDISRPYRYAPLRPSAVVTPDEGLERELHLEPGRYEVRVEAFVGVEAEGPGAVVVGLAPAGGDVVADGGPVGPVVEEPLTVELVVPEGSDPATRFAIGSLGKATVLVHGWSLTRVAA